ncbi:MAG: DUF484 family protein [Ectothiorhodospiraceae bacterium]|nr:DUF484 family protein [Ectothiorhodospiraceae bacterium]
MSTQQKIGFQEPPTDESVAAFLEQDPAFFQRHPELVERLQVPHACGDAVSLVEHQVSRLQKQNRQLRARLDELLDVARENDRLFERMHRLTLELLHPHDLDGMLQALKDGLRNQFHADFVALRLIVTASEQHHGGQAELVPDDDPALEQFSRFLREGRPECGQLDAAQLQFLFGRSATRVASTALVRLRHPSLNGMLAIGSLDPERFQPSQGTVFLRQLADLAAFSLAPHLRRS